MAHERSSAARWISSKAAALRGSYRILVTLPSESVPDIADLAQAPGAGAMRMRIPGIRPDHKCWLGLDKVWRAETPQLNTILYLWVDPLACCITLLGYNWFTRW